MTFLGKAVELTADCRVGWSLLRAGKLWKHALRRHTHEKVAMMMWPLSGEIPYKRIRPW
jgi:hypothetical protein